MANRKNSMSWSLKASTVRTLAWDLESRKEPCWVPCLLIVNDISNDITSNIKLFADDSLLYGLVHNSDDAISLQSDLDKLVEWAKLWQMVFNPSKCYVLRVCRTIDYAWSYRTDCRPLSLPRSFFVRGPILEATKQRSYCCSGSRKDSFRI